MPIIVLEVNSWRIGGSLWWTVDYGHYKIDVLKFHMDHLAMWHAATEGTFDLASSDK